MKEEKVEVNIIRKKDMFCFETAFSTICYYYGVPYQLLFDQLWVFDYIPRDELVGKNIEIDETIIFKKMILLGFDEVKLPSEKLADFKYIKEMLDNGYLGLIRIDMERWNRLKNTNFKSKFAPFLIYDCDEDYYVYDLHFQHDNIKIKRAFLHKVAVKATFYKKNDFYEKKIKTIYKIDNIFPGVKPNFDGIKVLAQLFKKGKIDFAKETRDIRKDENPISAPLIEKIETLARWRNLYSLYLDYLNQNLIEIDISEEIEKMSYFAGRWNLIKAILIKAFYKNQFDKATMNKIASILMEIYFGEKNLYEEMHNKANVLIVKKNNKIDGNDKTNGKIYVVNLYNYYNNAGIKFSDSNKIADLTGLGAYIELERNAFRFFTTIDNYRLYDLAEMKNDNIVCNGQKIYINKANYKKLHILGCSDYGSFSDYLEINYNFGKKIHLLNFTSWVNREPLYDDKVYYTSKLKEIHTRLNKEEATLFEQVINLEHGYIQFVILPRCQMIHIFGFLLEK